MWVINIIMKKRSGTKKKMVLNCTIIEGLTTLDIALVN